jgi:GH25 family lysozyme M1 (1,4-beta-N-acetylmuramidase)
MTIYFPDVSSFQAGVNLHGALAVIIKATEGTSYVNPELGAQLVSARAAGCVIARYHFLYSSRAASISAQARHAFSVASDRPLALDVEEQVQASSAPSIADVENFIDEYKALGGVLHLVYLPHWYWQQIGSPSLSGLVSRHCALWSSVYVSYTDSDSGEGWQPYGGMAPAVWQYSDATHFGGVTCDFSAFRGTHPGQQDPASVAATVAEFKNLLSTGSITPPAPSGPFKHVTTGNASVADLAADRNMLPADWLAEQRKLGGGATEDALASANVRAGVTWYSTGP